VRRSYDARSIEDGSHGAEHGDLDDDAAPSDEVEVRAAVAAPVRRAAYREPEGSLPAALLERQLRHVRRHLPEWILRRRLTALRARPRTAGHVLVRHPDWETAYRMSFAAANDIRMFAE
jgi:hypothetical protein